MKFFVHSTFRDRYDHQPLRPHGLQWDLDGESHVRYVPVAGCVSSGSAAARAKDSTELRLGIVQAHNLWCFAKDLPYKKIKDIQRLSFEGGTSAPGDDGRDQHIHVTWNKTNSNDDFVNPKVSKLQDVSELLRCDDLEDAPEVWINGILVETLAKSDNPTTAAAGAPLDRVLQHVAETPSRKLCFKRSPGLIRIDRYFSSYLRNRTQVFDHILDNLIAMEDVEMIDDSTLIGTATIPDWIMGGELTSRLWIRQESNGDILFLRPLYNDDVSTSDRQFELVKDKDDDEKIAVVMEHLSRLRYLASLEHPFVPPEKVASEEETSAGAADPMKEIREKLAKNRRGRKFFAL